MREIDHAVKVVCSRHPNCFLDLFCGRDHGMTLVAVEDTQLQIPEHRADKIWRIHDGKKEGCLLLEAITEPDKRDFPRINLKHAAVRVELGLPVVTVLVYLQRGKYKTFPASFSDELGGLVGKQSYTKILLWKHEKRIRSGELKELAPFLPLFYEEPKTEILGIENELIESVNTENERLELKSVAAIIGARKFSEEIIKQYLKLEYPMIREKTIFTEWLDESRAEGKIEGKHAFLLKQAEKRFGRIPDELKLSVENLNSEDSDALAMDLFDLRTMDDLKLWLEKMVTAR